MSPFERISFHEPPSDKPHYKSSMSRPSTPHPNGKNSSSRDAFKFDDDDTEYNQTTSSSDPVGGCIGISLAEIMRSFHGSISRPTSPLPNFEDDGDARSFFQGMRSIIRQAVSKKLKPMHCAHRTSKSSYHVDQSDVMSWLSDEGTYFDGDKSLLQRAASWNTHETEQTLDNSNSHADEEGNNISANGIEHLNNKSSKHVQFQYPPISSLHLRPRTELKDICNLYFAPEELDQIEDDRLDMEAVDDVETLVVAESNDWNVMPMCTSSTVTSSADDRESQTLTFIGNKTSDGMYSPSQRSSIRSPTKNNDRDKSRGDKRFVQGVQIMLREKSLG